VNELQKIDSSVIQKLVLDGDISQMSKDEKVMYYNKFCQNLGLNALTQPFQIINFKGKQKLYATKDCTEQLRKIHGVSISDISAQKIEDVYVVTAKAIDKNGKVDVSTGAVSLNNLKGEELANALMKAETKAKRRVTLSICGLGILDESETDTMKGSITEDVQAVEVKAEAPAPKLRTLNDEQFASMMIKIRASEYLKDGVTLVRDWAVANVHLTPEQIAQFTPAEPTPTEKPQTDSYNDIIL
jgi:hypothetical protein